MKSIRLRTQRVTIALEFPGRVVQASTAELFSSSNPSVNNFTHLAENPKLAECLGLLIGNGSLQAPYLDHSLANGNHLSAFSNSADSAIADQLRIKSQQSFRFLRISDCSVVFHSIRRCVPSTLPIEIGVGTMSFFSERDGVNLMCRLRRGWRIWMRSSGHRQVSMISCPSKQSPVSLFETYEPWSLLPAHRSAINSPRKANRYVCGCAIEQEASIPGSAQRLFGRRATRSDGSADNQAARLRNSPCPMVH
jgi:hypothetical protein